MTEIFRWGNWKFRINRCKIWNLPFGQDRTCPWGRATETKNKWRKTPMSSKNQPKRNPIDVLWLLSKSRSLTAVCWLRRMYQQSNAKLSRNMIANHIWIYQRCLTERLLDWLMCIKLHYCVSFLLRQLFPSSICYCNGPFLYTFQ